MLNIFPKQKDKLFTVMKLIPEGDHTKKLPLSVATGKALSWKQHPEDLLTWEELEALPIVKQILVPSPSVPFRVGVLLKEGWLGGKELICIDLDHVPKLVAQARQGKIADTSPQGQVLKLALERGFYVEVSQSGEGLHLLTLGHKVDPKKIRNDKFEYYDRGRWITLTGDAIAEYTGEEVDLEQFEKVMWPNGLPTSTQAPAAVPAVSAAFTQEDIEKLIEKAKSAKNGTTFEALYNGESFSGDTSSDDLAFCDMLAFWTAKNAVMMDTIFRASKRMRPKWEEVHFVTGETYGQMTIKKAIESTQSVYSPKVEVDKNFSSMEELVKALVQARRDWDKAHMKKDESIPPIKPAQIVKVLLKVVPFAIVYSDSEEDKSLYFYNPDQGIYSQDRYLLEGLVLAVAPELTQEKARVGILDTIFKSPTTGIPVVQNLASTPQGRQLLAVGNGILNLNTLELKPFSPEYYLTQKIETDYKEEGGLEEPVYDGWSWSKAIHELADGDSNKEKLLWQICKAAITGASYLRQAVLLVDDGQGQTGKSTFEDAIVGVVGRKNTAQLRFAEFSDETKLVDAMGKSLIVGDDNDVNSVISRFDFFNPVISGELVRVRRYYEASQTTRLNAFVLQSCNGVPPLKGATQAVFNRLKIVKFAHTHNAKRESDWRVKHEYIKKQEFKEWLLWYTVTHVELGVALQDTQESTDLLEETKLEVDSVANFIQDWLPRLESTCVPAPWLYSYYTTACVMDNLGDRVLPQKAFTRELLSRVEFTSQWERKRARPKPDETFSYNDVCMLVDLYRSTRWGKDLKTWLPITSVAVKTTTEDKEEATITKQEVLYEDFLSAVNGYHNFCFVKKQN